MIKVHISIGNNNIDEWDKLKEFDFEPYDNLYPKEQLSERHDSSWGINKKNYLCQTVKYLN